MQVSHDPQKDKNYYQALIGMTVNLWSGLEAKGVPHWQQLLLSATYLSTLQSVSTMVQRSKPTGTPLGNPSNNLEADGRRMNGEGCGETRNIGWVCWEGSRTCCIYTWKHPSYGGSVCCSWWPGKYLLTESTLVYSSPSLVPFHCKQNDVLKLLGHNVAEGKVTESANNPQHCQSSAQWVC